MKVWRAWFTAGEIWPMILRTKLRKFWTTPLNWIIAIYFFRGFAQTLMKFGNYTYTQRIVFQTLTSFWLKEISYPQPPLDPGAPVNHSSVLAELPVWSFQDAEKSLGSHPHTQSLTLIINYGCFCFFFTTLTTPLQPEKERERKRKQFSSKGISYLNKWVGCGIELWIYSRSCGSFADRWRSICV